MESKVAIEKKNRELSNDSLFFFSIANLDSIAPMDDSILAKAPLWLIGFEWRISGSYTKNTLYV
jgi:hypothetical protein